MIVSCAKEIDSHPPQYVSLGVSWFDFSLLDFLMPLALATT